MKGDQGKPQADLNWHAFCALPESVKTEYAGKSVLLRDGEVDSYWPDRATALEDGFARFGAGNFSVETVNAKPVDLGLHAHLARFHAANGPDGGQQLT